MSTALADGGMAKQWPQVYRPLQFEINMQRAAVDPSYMRSLSCRAFATVDVHDSPLPIACVALLLLLAWRALLAAGLCNYVGVT